MAGRFQGVLLFVSYWIPAFVAIVAIDWRYRSAGREEVNPAEESTGRADAWVALGCSWSRSPRRCRSCTPT